MAKKVITIKRPKDSNNFLNKYGVRSFGTDGIKVKVKK